jgi:hypothetical protein
MEYLTQQFSINIQYVIMPMLIALVVLTHMFLRRQYKLLVYILPLQIYLVELFIFYVVRLITTYYNTYDINVFTALSSLIRLQFLASYLIVFGYLVYKEYKWIPKY